MGRPKCIEYDIVIMQVDLEKGFATISLDFIEATMIRLGIGQIVRFINWDKPLMKTFVTTRCKISPKTINQ